MKNKREPKKKKKLSLIDWFYLNPLAHILWFSSLIIQILFGEILNILISLNIVPSLDVIIILRAVLGLICFSSIIWIMFRQHEFKEKYNLD